MSLAIAAVASVLSALSSTPAASIAQIAQATSTPSATGDATVGESRDGESAGGDSPDGAFALERIMADPEWIARSPHGERWSLDGRHVRYLRERAGSDLDDLFEIDLATGEERRVPDAERTAAELSGGAPDPGGSGRAVLAHRGDLYLWAPGAGVTALTRTSEDERAALLLLDGRVAYERGGVLFARDLARGLESELVAVRFERDPDDVRREEDEERGHLARREEALFRHVAEARQRREGARARERELEAADPARPPRPWYLGKAFARMRAGTLALGPTGDVVAVRAVAKRDDEGERDVLTSWVTETGLMTTRPVRPPVGTRERQPERLVLLDLATRAQVEVDLGALPGAHAAPAAPKPADEDGGPSAIVQDDAPEDGDGERRPRAPAVRVQQLVWSPDGARLAFGARSLDDHQWWVAWVARDGALTTVHHLVDDAWVSGEFDAFGWLPDGSALWFLSEASGWSHLHLADAATGAVRAVTQGEYEVSDVVVDRAGRALWWKSSAGDLAAREVWWLRLDDPDARPERLTDFGGMLDFAPSPDGTRVLLSASRSHQPPELFVQDARPGAERVRLTHTIEPAFAELACVEPEIVAVPAREDRRVWSRLFLPPEGHALPAGQRPAVLFVHGAGYLQQAHKGWSYYFRETLFHTLLARRGAVVLEMDYRASAGYGRDWRTAIRLGMGEPELDDLEDGVRWLVAEHGVDPARVGIYGGSYGGFLTLQALFTRPELFACGAALRSVTDWAHYNDGYTANILDRPQDAPEAYARSSPIDHAAGLARPLLMTHGLVDDNVLPKDSVRLAQRLIELGKTDWELALYPVEPHGFVDPASWLDQYRRILGLFERHLGLVPRPAASAPAPASPAAGASR